MMEEKYREAFAPVHPSEDLKRRTLEEMKRARRARSRARVLRPLGALAACFAVFAAGVNLSPAFAQAVEEIPVVGGLARVLSVRSYIQQDEDKTVHVDQPALDPEAGDFALDVNARIQREVDSYLAEANARIEAEKEAFLATGGTEAEFAARNVEVTVDYEILSQSAERLSFALRAAQSDVNALTEIRYYNLDLRSGKELTLEDVLGANYARIAEEAIRQQMAERAEVPYFSQEAGGFAGVDRDTAFYLNQDGNPVVVFASYAVAPGGYGPQEFEIKR